MPTPVAVDGPIVLLNVNTHFLAEIIKRSGRKLMESTD
ncbi:MAG: hypothetical protein ACI915_005350, partial [Gammaproteobacteria bacterium]